MILKGISVNQDPPTKDYLWITPKGNTRFWDQSTWRLIGGSGGGDMSNYYTKSDIDGFLANYLLKTNVIGTATYAAVFTGTNSISSATESVRIGDAILKWENGGIHVYNANEGSTAGIYADWVSALGANSSGGGGGGGMDETALWQELTDNSSWAEGDNKIINVSHLPNIPYTQITGVPYRAASLSDGGPASSLGYEYTNEINFRYYSSSNSNVWFNYRNGDTGSADTTDREIHYWFGNYNQKINKTTLHSGYIDLGNSDGAGFLFGNTKYYFLKMYNASDTYGNCIVLGSGGQTIVGAGESAETIRAANTTYAYEDLHLGADDNVYLHCNVNNGWSYRKTLRWYNGQIGLLGDITTTDASGIFWHTMPSSSTTNASYGIYKTAGSWSGNYQQLKLDWPTGIILDGGSKYGRSGVQVNGILYINDYVRIGQGENVIDGYRRSNDTYVGLHLNYYSTGNTTLSYGGGYVGIGTTSPETKLHVTGTIRAKNAGETYVEACDTTSSLRVVLDATNSQQGIWTNGYWNGSAFVTSNLWMLARKTDGHLNLGTNTEVSGNLWATGAVTALQTSSSDRRLKKNIKKFNAKDIIDKLNPVEFEWNSKAKKLSDFQDGKNYGLIAQDSDNIIDNFVFDLPGGKGYKGVRYEKLTPILLQAIKEQQSEIDELKKLIKDLKYEIYNKRNS